MAGPTEVGDPMQPEVGDHPVAPERQERSTNGKAMGSLILGVIGVTGVPFMASVVAIILGHMARHEIAETGQEGKGLATTGIVLGWIGVVLVVTAVAFFSVLFATVSSN